LAAPLLVVFFSRAISFTFFSVFVLLESVSNALSILFLLVFFGDFVLSSFGFDLLALGVSVHEEIDHNVPLFIARNFTSELENFTGHEPEHVGNGVAGLVVGWDGNVDPVERGVGVTKRDNWDVHV